MVEERKGGRQRGRVSVERTSPPTAGSLLSVVTRKAGKVLTALRAIGSPTRTGRTRGGSETLFKSEVWMSWELGIPILADDA